MVTAGEATRRRHRGRGQLEVLLEHYRQSPWRAPCPNRGCGNKEPAFHTPVIWKGLLRP